MEKLEFKEQQRFRQLDVLLILGFLLVGLIARFVQHQTMQLGNNFSGYVLLIVLLIGALIYFYSIRLITVINQKGVRFQYYPWHYKKKKIDWKDIDKVELVKSPLNAALTGWNIRFSNDNYYSVSGYRGLKIDLKNGETIFLGTKNAERLKDSLEALGKLVPPDQIATASQR